MKRKIIAAAVSAMLCGHVYAQSNFTESNMGFESGTTGWTIGAGNTGTMTTTITGSGTGISLITGTPGTVTFSAGAHPGAGVSGSAYYQPPVSPATWTFSAYGNNMLALQPNATTNWSTVGAELGLTSTQITSLSSLLQSQATASGFGSGTITNLAYTYRTVSLTAGTTYRMAWNYIGTDYVPFNDGSITTLVPVNGTTGTTTVNNYTQNYALLGFTNPGTGDYSAGTFGSTGWQVSTYSVNTTGDYQLGFAVFNLDDTSLSPVLLVDDLQGATTKNGTTFGAVAPNPGTSAPSSSTTPSTPTLVSSTAGTPIVSTSTSTGTSITNTAVTAGITVTVITITDTRTGATKVLSVNRNINTVATTPITTTVTTTTPVTTTTTTTPTTVNTYSDGSTTTVNGTPVTTTTTSNQVTVATNTVDDVQTSDVNQAYTTRIDQIDYLSKANQRFNQQLDSDPLSRNAVKDDTIVSKTDQNAENGVFYITAEGQRSNTSDTYSMRAQRFGFGHEKLIQGNWLVGAQFNQINSSLSGYEAGGTLDKTHIGLYSLYVQDGWILKSDLALSENQYKNYHNLPELQMSNSGSARGRDLWLSNRLYAPSVEGFRPFVGAKVENTQRNQITESGSELTAMTYDRINNTRTIGEAGVRYEQKLDSVNLAVEAGRSTNDITTVKVGASFVPEKNILGNVNVQQQRQGNVVNNILQATLKWLF